MADSSTQASEAGPVKPELPAASSTSGARPVLALALACIVASGAFLAWTQYLARQQALDAAGSTLEAFATVSEDQTGQAIWSIDQSLQLVEAMLARTGATHFDTDPTLHVGLRQLAMSRPLVGWLRVVRVDETTAFASHAHLLPFTEGDRTLLRNYRDSPDKSLVIVLPTDSAKEDRVTDLILARPWRHADGALAGAIVMSLDRSYFERKWTAGTVKRGMSISLLSRSGIMLLRSPPVPGTIGRSFADTMLFTTILPSAPQGTYRNPSGVLDGKDRLLSYRVLSDYPSFVIVVGRHVADVLAPWRQNAWLVLVSWAAVSGAGLLVIALLRRRLRTSAGRMEKLRLANEYLLNTSVDVILVVTRSGEFVQVSPSVRNVLGYAPEEMVGRNGVDFVYSEDLESTRSEMRLARHGHVVRNFDCRYIHKDGHTVVLSWAGAWSEAAQLYFFIGRDMTEQKQLELALRQAQKMEVVGQLTGGVAHDFNNLLTVTLGAAEVLAGQLEAVPQQAALANMIVQAATRGASLTRSLLAFSRKQALEPRATDVSRLIQEMGPMLRRTLGEQVQVELNCDDTLPPIEIDPAQLETALLNLCINARDAMPRGGHLTIATEAVTLDADYTRLNPDAAPGAYVAVAVSDTGTGMSPAVLAQVFEPFFTTKEVGKGSGLGLSMVYGFVKQSNGHVKIYSEPDHGTTVRLYLPLGEGAAVAEDASTAAIAPAAAGETILVVEDDKAVRDYVVSTLESMSYKVLAAGSGPESLEILRGEAAVDLLFTDVVMPGGMNGAELAQAARKLRPDLKVLYTSGYTRDAIAHQGRLDPGVELMSKPYRRTVLAAKIRQVLQASA